MPQVRRRMAVWLGVLLTCCFCAFAVDPTLDMRQHAHRAWKISEGFSKGGIYSIAQTPDGYLWMGTRFGLLRFDGVRNVPWRPPGAQHLPAGTIQSLLASRDGTLWIGANGLASWKNGRLTQYSDLAGQTISALREDREGTLWVGTIGDSSTGRLCAIRDGNARCYGDDGSLGPGVFALYEDKNGSLWAGVKDGLWRWKPGPPKFYSLASEPDGIQAIAEDANGALLVGRNGGIYRFVDGKTEPYSLTGASRKFRAVRMLRDRNGGLWIGSKEFGLLHVHQRRKDALLPADDMSGEDVYALFEDREGNIWVGTRSGFDRFRDAVVATLTANQGLSNSRVGSVVADKDGSVWLATYGGLNRWQHGGITIPPTGSAKLDGKIKGFAPNPLFRDDRGRIWLSTPRDVGYLEDGRFTPIKRMPIRGRVASFDQDTAGNMWVVDENFGLVRISRQNAIQQVPWAQLGHRDHGSILAADPKQGGLWIGFLQGGIVYFADGAVRASHTAADGLGEDRVSAFEFDDDGTVWVSTEGGLSRVKNNHVVTLTSKNGLPCDAINWVIQDDDRSLWLYMTCGMVQIARSELDAWAAAVDKAPGASLPIKVTVFDSSDGVRSLSEPHHYNPQVAKASDGKLWFLPAEGVNVVDPRYLPFNNLPPPVQIEQIIANGKTYDSLSQLRLPPHIRDLLIDYTALSFVAAEKVLFRYKLEGWDRDWTDVGNRRQAFYTNLPPRNYRFRVTACNNSGVWNEAGTFLDFSVAPAYYQTNWFRALCLAAFLVLLWALYQLRLRQLALQFNMTLEARVGERTRIARELHDTLLQSFQGLMLRFQSVDEMLPERPIDAKKALEGALDRADEAISEGRDAITDIRTSTLASRDLAKAITALMTNLSEELAAGNGRSVTFRVLVEGVPRAVRPTLQDEIYRIARESLRNAFCHAQAGHIETEIMYGESLRLRFRDDGKGIDPSVVEHGGRSGHWGLPGIRERAKQIGAQLTVWSELGAGTEVELSILGSIAYEVVPRARFRLFHKRAG